MKAKFSPLQIHVFELLESSYEFIVPKQDEIDIPDLFNSYTVDVDFNHIFRENDEIQLFVKIQVNNLKKPKVGYKLSAEGMGIFEINKTEKLSEGILGNLKFYSTLNMMINNLRNILFQISNFGPLKGYLLPPIDIMDLFKKQQRAAKP
jgi:preprotein translocase subunit SecB